MELFKSQKKALKKIAAHYRAWNETPGCNGFSVKPASLIVGPSGTGKSFVAKCLSFHLKVPVLYLSLGNWVPINSRGSGEKQENSTAALIYNFANTHSDYITLQKPVIIFVDEVDKLTTAESAGNTNWLGFVFNELLRILDGQWREFGYAPSETAFMKTGLYFLFAGAFQKAWRQKMGSLDFVEQLEIAGLDWGDLQETNSLPEELLNRIGGIITSVKHPDLDEVSEKVQEINRHFGQSMTDKAAEAEAMRILKSGQAIRGLESYFSAAAMRRYLTSGEQPPEPGYYA